MILSIVTALATLLALPPRPSAPCLDARCTCIERAEPEVALKVSDAVFVGSVLRTREIVLREEESGIELPAREVTLRVSRAWKGALGDTVVVTTGWGGGDCGYPFLERAEYLVYASRTEEGTLTTSICSRTRPAAGAEAEMATLGRAGVHARP